jgi:hypothetical protein
LQTIVQKILREERDYEGDTQYTYLGSALMQALCYSNKIKNGMGKGPEGTGS